MKNLLSLLLLFSIGLSVMAQYSPDKSLELATKYPDSNQILLNGKRSYVITKGEYGVDVQMNVLRDRLITGSSSLGASSEEVYTSEEDMDPSESIEAYSLIPIKGKYKKDKVEDFYVKDDMEGITFSNDGKVVQFYFPNTDQNVITHLAYSTKLKEAHFIPSVFTSFFMPYEEMTVEVVVDNDIDLHFDFMHMSADTLDYVERKGGKQTTHTWTFRDVPAQDYQSDAPDPRWYLPHIIVRVKGYREKGEYVSLLNDTDDLYELYRSWMDLVEVEETDDLKAITDSVVAGLETDEEKMRAIYTWVQSNIKYIAFAEGMRGVVPESAKSVMSCRFGDCKGMSNLMHDMAELQGIETYHTWIGTRDIPYRYDEVQSPLVDNHMILAFPKGDSLLFLDATDSYLPFGTPSMFIQGKQALVGIDEEQYRLYDVPILDKEMSGVRDSIVARIEGNDLVGSGRRRIIGYPSIDVQHRLERTSEKRYRDLMQALVAVGDDRFVLNDFETVVSDDKTSIVIEFDFRIPDFVLSLEDESYVNLNFDRDFGENLIDDGRLSPVDMGQSWSTEMTIVLELDEGQVVSHVPEDRKVLHEQFGFETSYDSQADRLTLESSSYSVGLMLYPESFDLWNELSKEFKKSISQNVVLKK